ncbi:hypothetical protein LSAT2_014429 [Lamellibrachia satsuma]|nr:hypothetical protein LSAT2_014429 [Lamellibrachia satsuma]
MIHRSRPYDVAGDEYCEMEIFKPKCTEGEVVVITNARYGRMSPGRCVGRDYGYLGCSTDVLDLADSWCSGRSSCQIPVPNSAFKRRVDCPKDLKPYFEVAYHCLQVQLALLPTTHVDVQFRALRDQISRSPSATEPCNDVLVIRHEAVIDHQIRFVLRFGERQHIRRYVDYHTSRRPPDGICCLQQSLVRLRDAVSFQRDLAAAHDSHMFSRHVREMAPEDAMGIG